MRSGSLCVTPSGKRVAATSAAVTWHTVNPQALKTMCGLCKHTLSDNCARHAPALLPSYFVSGVT